MEFYRRFFKYHKASTQTILFILLFLLGFTSRFLPHPYNFSPISAIAIFSGFFFGWKKAFLLPIAMMFFSDLFLGFYQFNLMFTVYAALAISAIAGFFLRKNFHRSFSLFSCCLAFSEKYSLG